jgi:DNA end-binding protein Ku
MSARAIWKGVLRFGKADVPVKLYSAVQDRSIHFRLLDAKQGEPVAQRMVHPETSAVVPSAEVIKGFAEPDGSFVVLQSEDIEKLTPKDSRDIAVSRFVPRGSLPRPFFVRPYYLGPDGDAAAYFALAEALTNDEVDGIAHWVMRKRAYDGLLHVSAGYLGLVTLRPQSEVIMASELPQPTGRAHTEKELAMAEQLIASYAEEAGVAEFRDEYRDRVLELVAKKAEGKRVRLKKVVEKRGDDDKRLAEMLAMSLKKTQRSEHVA